jgi:hypothetical protein
MCPRSDSHMATRKQLWKGGVSNEHKIFASCKFIGDDLHLRGSLLGEPQLFPVLVEFNHF